MEEHKAVTTTSVAKKTFSYLFLALVMLLMLFPFVTTFNELLTRIVENSLLYRPIETYFIPYQVVLVRFIISILGVQTAPGTVAIIKNGVNQGTFISWNCIGWQSLVILLFSLKSGLVGNYTIASKIQSTIVGILGTFLINIFRISLVITLLYYFGKAPATIIHDYGAVFVSIVWLFFFWWFSYRYILEEPHKDLQV